MAGLDWCCLLLMLMLLQGAPWRWEGKQGCDAKGRLCPAAVTPATLAAPQGLTSVKLYRIDHTNWHALLARIQRVSPCTNIVEMRRGAAWRLGRSAGRCHCGHLSPGRMVHTSGT